MVKSTQIHRLAQCSDCNWSCEDYLDNGIYTKAKNHAKKHKHSVTLETGRSLVYNYRD